MNKKLLLGIPVGVIALGAAGYVGAAWYAGSQIEKRLNTGIADLTAASPLLTVSDVKTKRGIFRTEHDMTIGFNADCFTSGMESDSKLEEAMGKMKIHLHHVIHHGPLGFSHGVQLQQASFEGNLVLDDKVAEKLKKLFGDKPALSWNGTLQFGGAHQFTLQSPAFTLDDKGIQVSWAGLQADGGGNINDHSYQIKLRAPKLEAGGPDPVSGEQGKALLENIQLAVEGRRSASGLNIGSGSMEVGKFHITDPSKKGEVELNQFGYTYQVKENGQFVDLALAYKIAGIVAGAEKKTYGPALLELGIGHLHAPTLLAFDKSMKGIMCAKPEQKQAMAGEMIGQWKQLSTELLRNKPELQLKQVRFSSPDGELQAKGRISIDGFEPAMLETPQTAMAALPGILQVEFAGQIPEKFLMSSLRGFALSSARRQMMQEGGGEIDAGQMQTLQEGAEQDARQKIGLALAQNYIKQDGDKLSIDFKFGKGQASLNGAPFDLPFLPQSAQAPSAQIGADPAQPGTPPSQQ